MNAQALNPKNLKAFRAAEDFNPSTPQPSTLQAFRARQTPNPPTPSIRDKGLGKLTMRVF